MCTHQRYWRIPRWDYPIQFSFSSFVGFRWFWGYQVRATDLVFVDLFQGESWRGPHTDLFLNYAVVCPRYTVRPGDTLQSISLEVSMPPGTWSYMHYRHTCSHAFMVPMYTCRFDCSVDWSMWRQSISVTDGLHLPSRRRVQELCACGKFPR